MKQILKIVTASLIAFAGTAIATESAEVEKTAAAPAKIYAPSIAALNKTFASGNVEDLKGFLSQDFTIEGYSADMRKHLLEQAFSQAKGKVADFSVVAEKKTQNGYDLTLKATNGSEFDVSVDAKGKFTTLNFFATKTAPPSEISSNITAPPHETVPFELFGGGGLIMVKGEVNGVEGYLFIDSGASQSMLNSEVLSGLKGEAIGTQGINGEITEASIVTVDSLKIGNIEFKETKALYQPLNHLAFGRSDIKMLGLIGYQELSHFETMFNYPKRNISFLTLDETGERVADAVLPEPVKTINFTLDAHLPILDCEVDGKKLRMGLDNGVEINLIDRKYSKKLSRQLQHTHKAESISADGTPVAIIVGMMPEFTVEGRSYTNMKTMFSDISHLTTGPGAMKIDGMIGFQFLSKHRLVSINFKKKELTLW